MCTVDLPSGRVDLIETDFEIPSLVPLVLRRYYRSNGHWIGDLGHGWGHTFGVMLWRESDDTLMFRGADGRRIPFAVPQSGEIAANPVEQMAVESIPPGGFPWPDLNREWQEGALAVHVPEGPAMLFDARLDAERYPWLGMVDGSKNLVRVWTGAEGQATRLCEPRGRILEFQRRSDGLLAEVHLIGPGSADSRSLLAAYEYDKSQDLVAVHDSAGTRRYEYRKHLVVRYSNRCGAWTEVTYGSENRCITTRGPDGSSARSYGFDRKTKTATICDSQGHKSSFVYDEADAVVQTVDEAGGKSLFDYDLQGRLYRVVDQAGHETIFAYGADGTQVGKVAPDGAASGVLSTPDGRLSGLINPRGALTQFDRDSLGRVTAITRPGQGTCRLQYAPDGTMNKITAPAGKEVSLVWAPDGSALNESDAEGVLTAQQFDAKGRLISLADATGAVTRYEYDEAGWLASIVRPDEAVRRFAFDPEGRVTALQDESGHVAKFEYDEAGCLIRNVLPTGLQIRCEFDSENRLTGIQGPDRLWHHYKYDARGLVVAQDFSDGRHEEYRFDPNGKLVALIDPAGGVTVAERDPAGRVIRVAYPDGTEKRIIHDEAGQWRRIESTGHVLEREITAEGLPLLESQDDFVIRRTYDDSGAMTSATDSLGRRVTYAYDDEGRVVGAEVAAGRWRGDRWEPLPAAPRTHVFAYNRRGDWILWKMPGGKIERRRYDARRRMIEQVITKDDRVLVKREYAYDPAGRLLTIRDSRRGRRDFTYSPLGEIASVAVEGGRTQFFSFDAMKGLLIEVAEYDGQRPRHVQGETYSYDVRGYLVRRDSAAGVEHLSYTPSGLLQAVRGPANAAISFEYDGLTRLVKKSGTFGQCEYFWNNEDLWAMRRDGDAVREFLNLPKVLHPVEQSEGDRHFTIHVDPLGRPQELIDDDGNIVWTDTAGVWGEGRSPGGAPNGVECPFGAPGLLWDADLRLYYNRYRFYNPHTARYLTPDPIGIWGGLNAYAYLPDPVNFCDPLGLKCRGKTDDPILYRGDDRGPSDICSQGFQPRNPSANISLNTHVEGVPGGGSNWVSTTHDQATADNFGDGGYVYVISNPGCGHEVDCDPDAIAKYGPDPAGSEHEIAFNKAIPPDKIVGYYQPSAGGISSFQAC